MKTLFDHNRERILREEQPLAARMRPRTLDEYVGQSHILAPGRLLRRAIQADQLSSLIFYGPPGTGKTTLASVIANTTKSHFTVLNAVLAGKADIRDVIRDAQDRLGEQGTRTILFVDEVHRWNKAQQDALLPWVENGTLILIGATTENPYFSVNRALVSRSRVFQLTSLGEDDLRKIAEMAIHDPERGYGNRKVNLLPDALTHLARVASGDARALLNALELAIETTPPAGDGTVTLTLEVAEDSIQQRAVLYDQEGDYHFDIISAFIKSMRGSDPDAAVYWLAKMVYAGEDPRYLFRRMIIFAAEDIGLADPHALRVVNAAAEAFDRVGMPEGRYHLGMAALYLSTAPKSNSVFGFFDALAAVAKEADADVPNHLRDASRDKESFGHGQGYLYPHAYRDHWVAQQYLPQSLQGRLFYQPGDTGYEKQLHDDVIRRREAQLAAVLEADEESSAGETLTHSTADSGFDTWLERSMGGTAKRLEAIRREMFAAAGCGRHHTVLILNDEAGLLVWEAVRQVPEGGVWTQVSSREACRRIASQTSDFPDLRIPQTVLCPAGDMQALLDSLEEGLKFDRILGRNLLGLLPDPTIAAARLKACLGPEGKIVLSQPVPTRSRKLSELLPVEVLPEASQVRLKAWEKNTGGRHDGSLSTEEDIKKLLAAAGFSRIRAKMVETEAPLVVSERLIERWFGCADPAAAESYRGQLHDILPREELAALARATREALAGQTVPWQTVTGIFTVS